MPENQNLTTARAQTPQHREERLRPPIDAYETAEGLTILADLPGVSKEDLSLELHENVLTIQGLPKHSLAGAATHQEFALATFYRQVPVADTYNAEKITAELTNGVLKVFLPRAEQAKPKQIAVQVG